MGKKSKTKQPKDDEDRFDISKPQFRRPKRAESRVFLDERFSSVLTDPRFQLDIQDKYGREEKKKKKPQEELGAFYTVEEGNVEKDPALDDDDTQSSASSTSEASNKEEDPASRIAYLTALSRGEISLSDSSSGEETDSDERQNDGGDRDESSDDEEEEDPIHGTAGMLDPSSREDEPVELTFEESSYLAVLNMEWSHIRAVDVFAIVSSFAPPGSVRRVRVYASDFGMERMAKEDQFGPTGLWKKEKKEVMDDGNDDPEVESDNNSDQEDIDSVQKEFVESDFDAEKLRAYEASKLKYYFAIVEFSSPEHADKAYKEIDGMEFEHSSAAVDMRSIPADEIDGVTKDRPMRDEATSLPSNYEVPEFIVGALQQTNVQCSWETEDRERERYLTKYGAGKSWQDMAEKDDLKVYLASDVSSDEDEEEEMKKKGSSMRKLLGLDDDSEDDHEEKNDAADSDSEVEEEQSEDEGNDSDVDGDLHKEMTFTPGKNKLADEIRSKLDRTQELTPWEKYQEKRKEKRRARRQAARDKKQLIKEARSARAPDQVDDFFLGEEKSYHRKKPLSQAELELLVAGENEDDDHRDFDMRGVQRADKNKNKILRGSRKRKEEAIRISNAAASEFEVDISDSRFKVVLDGEDDRFGIDPSDANYKETPAMRKILKEQTRRRKHKRQKKVSDSKLVADVEADTALGKTSKPSGGAAALSALVTNLKSKHG